MRERSPEEIATAGWLDAPADYLNLDQQAGGSEPEPDGEPEPELRT